MTKGKVFAGLGTASTSERNRKEKARDHFPDLVRRICDDISWNLGYVG